MGLYIKPENNARFFTDFQAQLQKAESANGKPLISYNAKKGFAVEKKSDRYSITRFLFIQCTGKTYSFEESATNLLDVVRKKASNDATEENDQAASIELIAATKTCQKLKQLCQHVMGKKGSDQTESEEIQNEYEIKSFELLSKAARTLDQDRLLVSCKNGLFDMAITLIEQGQDETIASQFYDELLFAACQKGNFELAVRLIARGAKLTLVKGYLLKLLEAAITQKVEGVAAKVILECPALLENTSKGISFLYLAISLKLAKTALLLIPKTASKDVELQLAIANCLEEVACALLDKGAKANQVFQGSEKSLFQVACEQNLIKVALKLIQKGLDVNFKAASKNPSLEYPIQIATKRSLIEVIKALLEKEVDLSKLDSNGNSATHNACIQGSIVIVDLFLAYPKANFTQLNSNQQTPLQAALESQKWRTNRVQMQEFFYHFFKDITAVRDRIKDSRNVEFLKYFRRYPSTLIDVRLDGEKANPLEVPLLFNDRELAKNVSQRLTQKRFTQCVNAIYQKYPGTNTDVATLSVYEINKAHLANETGRVEVPPKPPGVEAWQLVKYLMEINFTNPEADDYYDPKQLYGEYNMPQHSSGFKDHLEKFIRRIVEKPHEVYVGTPDPGPAQVEFYTTIENAVTNIIKKLSELGDSKAEKKQKRDTTIEFLRGAGYCGGKWYLFALREFNKVVLGKNPTFTEIVFYSLGDYREVLAQSLVHYDKDYGQDVHGYNQILFHMGKELGLPGWETMQKFRDKYGRVPNKNDLRKKFYDLYTAFATAVEWIEPRIRNEVDFREKFLDWCKANVPKEWGKERYNPIKEAVRQKRTDSVALKEIEKFLQDTYEIYVALPGGKKMTPEQAIEDDRIMSYIGLEVIQDMTARPMRVKKSAVAFMLEKMVILTVNFAKEEEQKPVRQEPVASSSSTQIRKIADDPPPSLIGMALGLGNAVRKFFGW